MTWTKVGSVKRLTAEPPPAQDWIRAANLPPMPPPRPTREPSFCECGCLLAHPEESCPRCLYWATSVAVRASWIAAAHDPTFWKELT